MQSQKALIIIVVISLLAVTTVSGCIGTDFFDSLFGKVGDIFGIDVIKPSREVQSVGTANPLAIDRVWTMPENRVLPEATLSLFMELSNKDNDPTKEITNVYVDIFDAGVFKDRSASDYCNNHALPKSFDQCGPDQCAPSSQCVLRTGATKQITFEVKAPTKDEIANVITKAKLNYRVNYDYNGATNFEVLAVGYDEIIKRQKDGKTLTTNLIDSKSSGPIKIDVELGAPYIITTQTGSTTAPSSVKSKAYIIFKLRNAGAGALKDSVIEANKFKIHIPAGLPNSPIVVPTERDRAGNTIPIFSCTIGTADVVCENIKRIEFFKTESEPFLFEITDVKELPVDVPHKTFLITSEVEYTYELRGISEVEINPIIGR